MNASIDWGAKARQILEERSIRVDEAAAPTGPSQPNDAGVDPNLINRLLEAAMRVCDRHGDDAAARAEMRADCLATPVHLRADLLEHLRSVA